ncbi:hypothetical protein HK097_008897 [Rhizophlyctis rosea]|uniref:Uncharacterized protein n=1 Tax=Rhizophlyctis rosea TaxID=64517 RepID=A0AAD5SBV1_9FUNG|nr:hypothetical protein HK097_008897 [Rhizophlyctis rosea]
MQNAPKLLQYPGMYPYATNGNGAMQNPNFMPMFLNYIMPSGIPISLPINTDIKMLNVPESNSSINAISPSPRSAVDPYTILTPRRAQSPARRLQIGPLQGPEDSQSPKPLGSPISIGSTPPVSPIVLRRGPQTYLGASTTDAAPANQASTTTPAPTNGRISAFSGDELQPDTMSSGEGLSEQLKVLEREMDDQGVRRVEDLVMAWSSHIAELEIARLKEESEASQTQQQAVISTLTDAKEATADALEAATERVQQFEGKLVLLQTQLGEKQDATRALEGLLAIPPCIIALYEEAFESERRARNDVESLQNKLSDLRQQLESAQAERVKVQAELMDNKCAIQEVERKVVSAEERAQEAKTHRCEELAMEVERTNALLSRKTEEFNDAARQIAIMAAAVESISNDGDILRKQVRQMGEEQKRLRGKVAELELAVSANSAEEQKAITGWKATVESLNGQLEECRKRKREIDEEAERERNGNRRTELAAAALSEIDPSLSVTVAAKTEEERVKETTTEKLLGRVKRARNVFVKTKQ